MFEIVRYTAEKASEWDEFITQSKNGTFLFLRNYMDYHADRFQDFSLMFYAKGRLLAVLPANLRGDVLYSHQGLTYGGLISGERLTVVDTISLFRELNDFVRDKAISKVVYKCIPWIYHRLAAEEDLYALYHICHATMVARDFATCIFLPKHLRWERVRRRGVVRAQQAGLIVSRSTDFAPFWQVLTDNLTTKYGVRPVHTLQEIELLHSRFPDNIILYTAEKDNVVVGGVVLYVTPQVVHAQYSSATPEGKRLGAMDFLYSQIMGVDYAEYPYFDFGRSTDNADGSSLNEPLVFQKEGYGGRGLCYDIYEWSPCSV
ncbi:MAG: GNAT family N-acetyltransferase [Prevotella sp.]|nr:GNAT family N-acetyltransferase [Prevotella sp.]